METDFLKMVECATKAPSGHNTQPWRFESTGDGIVIVPDFDVALPVVDHDNRELYISLGCATENLMISAKHFGYEAEIIENGREGIRIRLTRNSDVVDDRLFYRIEKRQTNRSVYNGNRLSGEILATLEAVRGTDDIRVHFAPVGSSLADTLTDYIVRGNAIQMNDKAFKNELLCWMRFNAKQVDRRGDGLSYKVFGNPPLPGMFARPIVNCFLNAGVQNKSDRKKIESSSHLVLFTTRNNTLEEWIGLGRVLQHFLLVATDSGVACAYLNQPCEVQALASEMQKVLPIDNEFPTLIVRIGYAEAVPYSPRKKVQDVIM